MVNLQLTTIIDLIFVFSNQCCIEKTIFFIFIVTREKERERVYFIRVHDPQLLLTHNVVQIKYIVYSKFHL